jgi:hypothetical protein
MILAMSTAFATASFAESGGEVICYSGCEEEPGPGPKGNNGWGNGTDEVDGLGGTNNGSDDGGTAGTKSINGKGIDKFDGKFDGR